MTVVLGLVLGGVGIDPHPADRILHLVAIDRFRLMAAVMVMMARGRRCTVPMRVFVTPMLRGRIRRMMVVLIVGHRMSP
jgi:hypothetical protein